MQRKWRNFPFTSVDPQTTLEKMCAAEIESVPSAEERNGDGLIRSLIALPELPMRIAWLHNILHSRPLAQVAQLIDRIADRAHAADPRAREALLALTIYLSQNRSNPLLSQLLIASQAGSLLSLERMLRPPADAPPSSVDFEVKVPDYGTGRELSVGERRTLARRPTRLQIERLILDPHPLVLEQLFRCPGLTEDDVIQIASRRPAHLTALELLGDSPRWVSRRRVRMSLILNPRTPHGLALPLISSCLRDELELLVSTPSVAKTLRSVAHELYLRLPPVPEEKLGSISPH